MAKRKKDRVTEYARKVVAKKIIAGESVILACKRHLEDLKEVKQKNLNISGMLKHQRKHLTFTMNLLF
ncbi:hypothetical protein ACK2FW_04955 [Clostridioides difficile]